MPERTRSAVDQLRLRPLARKDLDEIVRIDAIHTNESKRAYWQETLRDFTGARTVSGRIALGAERDGRLVGFLLADVRAFEFGSERCGWILEVEVDPRATRAGVATALLEEARRRLRAAGVSTIRTMVRRNDVPVLTFFRTNGFAGGPYVQLESPADAGR